MLGKSSSRFVLNAIGYYAAMFWFTSKLNCIFSGYLFLHYPFSFLNIFNFYGNTFVIFQFFIFFLWIVFFFVSLRKDVTYLGYTTLLPLCSKLNFYVRL